MHVVDRFFHMPKGHISFLPKVTGKEKKAAKDIVNLLCEAKFTTKEAAWILKISRESLKLINLVDPESH